MNAIICSCLSLLELIFVKIKSVYFQLRSLYFAESLQVLKLYLMRLKEKCKNQ